MGNKDISLNKLLKISKSIFLEEWDQEFLECSRNFNLSANEYEKQCKNMINNAIEFEKYNLLEHIIFIYYSAVNNCSNLIEEKETMIESLGAFDTNLSILLNDKNKKKALLDKFNNILKFQDAANSNVIDLDAHEAIDQLIEYFYLYIFLYVGNKLDHFLKLGQYSFDKEIFEFRENINLEIDFSINLMENFNSSTDKIMNYIDDYLSIIINNTSFDIKRVPLINATISKGIMPEIKLLPENPATKKPEVLYYNDLENDLNSKIIGQEKAIKQITDRLKSIEYGITKKQGAKAVYMLLGPTGVGKTETVKHLNNLLRENTPLIRIDMSEYKLEHMSTKILGSPPSYIGHDTNQNVLEIIKKNPNAFILIDEIEKAHPTIVDLFLHMFDEGKAKNSRQEIVDLSNNVFFITSNIGANEVSKKIIGFNDRKEQDNKTYIHSLENSFRPEFINRLNEVIVFDFINLDDTYKIINLLIKEIEILFKNQKNIEISISLSSDAYEFLVAKTNYKKYGARDIRRTIEKYLLNNIVDYIVENGYNDYSLEFDINENQLFLNKTNSHRLVKK